MSQETNRRVILAGFLIVIGIFWILKNFGLIPDFIPHYLYSWEIVFVFVGLFIILTKRAIIPGIIFIGVGLFLLLPDIPTFNFVELWMLWPVILIAIGMSLLLQNRSHHDHANSHRKDGSNEDYLDELVIFGGGEKIVTAQGFKGGRITAIFGGSEINLLGSKLAKGPVYIDLVFLFGGGTLIVPQDWNVQVDMVSIFGGFSDKRTILPDVDDKQESILHVKGVAIFGGGEIKSYKK
jgi:predicted membrane protein